MRWEGAVRGSSRMSGLIACEAVACHHEAKLLDRDLAARNRCRHAAAIDDGDAVRKGENLVKVIGDEEDGRARIARLDEAPMHIGDGPDIEPARGLAGEDEFGIEAQASPEDE